MKQRRCSVCEQTPGRCAGDDDGQPIIHEHVYDEWWCTSCWKSYGEPWGEDQPSAVVDVQANP